jgi:5-formyltetrahydrofolate cyclo-ligase
VTGRGPREITAEGEQLLRQRAKQELRRRMRALRSALPQEARTARAEAAARRLLELPAFAGARTVLVYAPIGAEAPVEPIVTAARAAGKVLALPRVDFEAGRLRLHRWDPTTALATGAMGVPEPPPDAPTVTEAEVDLVVVPALGVDVRGHRLGYGKGFYDQLLPTLPNALRVALAYDFQLLAELPDTPGDVPVHIVVTDARLLAVAPWPGAS